MLWSGRRAYFPTLKTDGRHPDTNSVRGQPTPFGATMRRTDTGSRAGTRIVTLIQRVR
jgi:hypothetical protein